MILAAHLLAVTYFLTCVICDEQNKNEKEARRFLNHYDKVASNVFNKHALMEWQVFVNNTKINRQLLRDEARRKASFMRKMRDRALSFDASAMRSDTQRQLSKIKNIGIAAQPDTALANKLTGVMTEMEGIISSVKLCYPPETCSKPAASFLKPTDSHAVLSSFWSNWRNKTGRRMKSLFTKYVDLSNKAVKLTGYHDLGEQWRSRYESDTFLDDLRDLYRKIRPLYEQLHAYVRNSVDKLHRRRFPKSGQIPAYLLGNIMADEWSQIFDYTVIYKHTRDRWDLELEVYSLLDLLRMAEKYLVSLGFDQMAPSFWTRSTFYKTRQGQEGSWRAFVWDFFDQNEFRGAFPTKIGEIQYYDVYNKMAQIQYLMQYKDQPVIYREGANDAFLDAVGGAIELSVRNLDYLKKLGLTKRDPTTHYQEMNYQLRTALEKVALLPFAYLVDRWRWSVFNGSISPQNYNAVWWRQRCALQGVSPPVHRFDDAFDPGALYEIAANKPYIKYFLSTILQFQILKSLCLAAEDYGPLHKCDLRNSTAAGNKLRALMKLGSSVPWQAALRRLTGQSKIEADAMLEYFQPLLELLKCKNGKKVGWKAPCEMKIWVSG